MFYTLARYFTEEDLRQYNGATESTPIYIAVKGKVKYFAQ